MANEERERLTLQRTEMRMIRWMCGIKVTDRVTCDELRERLGVDDILVITVLQRHMLRWHVHVLKKYENGWVKTCLGYEVEGVRPRGSPKKTWELCYRKKLSKQTNMQGKCNGL